MGLLSDMSEASLSISNKGFSRIEIFVLIVVILIFVILNLYLSLSLNIWFDETFTLESTSGGVVNAFKRALDVELQAPLYFVSLAAWRAINDSIFFARMFSVMSVVCSLLIVARIAIEIFGSFEAIAVVIGMAFNPFSMWAATEIRSYGLAIMLSALLLLSFRIAFLECHQKRRRLYNVITYTAISTISIYTHYYLAFMFTGFLIYLIYLRRWAILLIYGICTTFLVIAFLPLLVWVMPSQIGIYNLFKESRMGTEGRWTALHLAKVVYGRVRNLVLSVQWLPRTARHILVYLILFVFISLLKKTRKEIDKVALFWISFAASLITLVAFTSVMGPDYIRPRRLFILYVPLLFSLYSVSLIVVQRNYRLLIFFCLSILMVLSGAIDYINKIRIAAKPGDYQRVARYIMNNEQSGQPILMFPASAALSMKYYYSGVNKLIPIPGLLKNDRYRVNDFIINSETQIEELIYEIAGNPDEFWYYEDQYVGMLKDLDIYNRHYLDRYLARRYTPIQETKFFESKVLLLRRNE